MLPPTQLTGNTYRSSYHSSTLKNPLITGSHWAHARAHTWGEDTHLVLCPQQKHTHQHTRLRRPRRIKQDEWFKIHKSDDQHRYRQHQHRYRQCYVTVSQSVREFFFFFFFFFTPDETLTRFFIWSNRGSRAATCGTTSEQYQNHSRTTAEPQRPELLLIWALWLKKKHKRLTVPTAACR